MKQLHSFLLITLYSIIILALLAPAYSQKPPSPETTPPQSDTAICKSIVRNYCKLWKSQKYDTMYIILNVNGLGSMTKEQFLNTYKAEADNRGKLSSFNVRKTEVIQDGIVVKVELRFVKEKAPILINGVSSFHVVKDKEEWKLKTIVVPISIPGIEDRGKSGGHPGE